MRDGFKVVQSCLLLSVVYALLNGCANSTHSAMEVSGGKPAPLESILPPPSQIRLVAYSQQELHQRGDQSSPLLPQQNVALSASSLIFSPDCNGLDLQLSQMAYGGYAFVLDGYEEEPLIWFTWAGTGDYSDAWVGIANFTLDRWDWQPMPFQAGAQFDPEQHFSETGEFFVMVICAGILPWQLQQVRLGPEFVAPEAALTANPLAGNAPLPVIFDASGSLDADGGGALQFEWDWDGNGMFEENTGSEAVITHTFTEAGEFASTVRVLDDDSHSSTASVNISISDYVLDEDTLYAIPLSTHAAVGEPVQILIATGQTPYQIANINGVGFLVEEAGEYVHDTYNLGIVGNARMFSDGYWALLGPPPPTPGEYLDVGDGLIPGDGELIGGGLRRLMFNITTLGSFDTPESIGNGAVLFNFQLSFTAPGVYHLEFQESMDTIKRTFYSDPNFVEHFWAHYDTLTVTVD